MWSQPLNMHVILQRLYSGFIILLLLSRFLVNMSLRLFVIQHGSFSLFLSRSHITLAKCQLEELIWAICIADPEKEEPSLKSHSLTEARASQRAPQEGGHRRYCWKSTLFVDAASRATERPAGGSSPVPLSSSTSTFTGAPAFLHWHRRMTYLLAC